MQTTLILGGPQMKPKSPESFWLGRPNIDWCHLFFMCNYSEVAKKMMIGVADEHIEQCGITELSTLPLSSCIFSAMQEKY